MSLKKLEDVDTDGLNSAKEIEYQREVSGGSLSWSNEGDEVDGSEAGLSPSTSNRLSPSKDDSSSGSSVEFIQKVSDSSLVAAGKVQNTAGLRESNEAKSAGCSERLLDVKGDIRLLSYATLNYIVFVECSLPSDRIERDT